MSAYPVFQKRNQIVNNYRLHDTIIPKTDKVKYLGVTLDDKLTFKEHVQKTTNKANAALGFVRRTVTTSSSAVKCTAYKQLVRPTLEYAAGAWDSVSKTSEAELEAVQDRKSTRLNSSHRCISYAVFCLKKKKKRK